MRAAAVVRTAQPATRYLLAPDRRRAVLPRLDDGGSILPSYHPLLDGSSTRFDDCENAAADTIVTRPRWCYTHGVHAYHYRLLQAELDHVLSSRDANGRPAAPRAAAAVPHAAAVPVPRAAAAGLVPRAAGAPPRATARAPSLLDALVGVRCTAEEALVPLLVLRSRQVSG